MNTLRKEKPGTTAFTFSALDSVLTLEIYDIIGADMFGDGITASAVSAALQSSDHQSVTLHLNSPGGDLFEGVAIYNVLKGAGKPVNVVVDGLAASAASLIAMAGTTITMGDGAMIMVHRAQGITAGYSEDMRTMADTLDTVTASAADVYVARTGMKNDEVMKLMAAETWMSAQDCMKNGFCTATSATKAKMTNSFDLSVFKNTPEALKDSKIAELTVDLVVKVVPEVKAENDFDLIDILRKRIALAKMYSEDQPREADGKWGSGSADAHDAQAEQHANAAAAHQEAADNSKGRAAQRHYEAAQAHEHASIAHEKAAESGNKDDSKAAYSKGEHADAASKKAGPTS